MFVSAPAKRTNILGLTGFEIGESEAQCNIFRTL